MNPTASDKPILFLAGHRGMVGSAIARRLQAQGDVQLLTASRAELNLLDQHAVNAFFQQHPIDRVIIARGLARALEDAYAAMFARWRAQQGAESQTVTLDGTVYNLAELSGAAQYQLANLRACDQEIQRLQHHLAIAKTARAAYANALKAELPDTTTH